MSPDSALRPVQRLLPTAAPTVEEGRSRPTSSSRLGRIAAGSSIRLPAAGQLLSRQKANSLGVSGAPFNLLLFAATAGLYAFTVNRELAFGLAMWESRTLAGIPQHLLLTVAVVVLAYVNDGPYLLRLLQRRSVILLLSCFLLFVFVGVFKNPNTSLVRADVYTVRWLFVGFLVMRLAIVSGSVSQYLIAASIATICTMVLIDDRNTAGGEVLTRGSSDFWPVINCAIFMLGMLVTVNWPRGVLHAAFCSSMFAVAIVVGGIRSSTRSLFLVQSACFLLCMLTLARDPRMRGRGRELRFVVLLAVLFGAVTAAYLVVTGQLFSDMTSLSERFSIESRERHDTWGARVDEAADVLENLAVEEWLFGMGAGGYFFTTLGYWASVPHISVLGWLQKGGIAILLLVLWNLYIYPVISLSQNILAPPRGTDITPPILIVAPPLLAWGLLTFISGGLDIGSFFGLGSLAALWLQLADDGRRYTSARKAARLAGG